MNHSKISLFLENREQITGMRKINQGKIVKKYNIKEAEVEYYLIPSINNEDYEIGKEKQTPGTHKKFGIQLKVSDIIKNTLRK